MNVNDKFVVVNINDFRVGTQTKIESMKKNFVEKNKQLTYFLTFQGQNTDQLQLVLLD